MAFFSGLGASILAGLGATAGSSPLLASAIVGTTAAAGMAGAAGVGVAQASKALGKMAEIPKSSQVSQAAAAVPASVKETAAETMAKSQETAQVATQARLKSARRSRSIYSSPLGIGGEASTVKKQLLGQ